jgi:hypothetical protein
MLAQREVLDALLALPVRQAVPQVALETGGGLVTFLGRLGEQLHDNPGDHARDRRKPPAGCQRLPRDVAVDPFHRIGGRERQCARKHLVEGDAERIEVAA